MTAFVFPNISRALPTILSNLLDQGNETGSRNGRVVEFLNTQITLTRPWEREVLCLNRGANVYAQIAETMWVLAGRSDIRWLSAYLPRAADYSDDGVVWRGGYGPRIRGNDDTSDQSVGATFSSETTRNGWFGMPDNCAIDSQGRLWISTDGNNAKSTGRADGLWAMETEGEMRGTSKHFFRVPVGGELCGPFFTPDDESLFLAVQHPGEAEEGATSTFENPITRWPDFKDDLPTRPSVLVITRQGGGKIA